MQMRRSLQASPAEECEDENKNGRHDDWEKYDDRNSNGKYAVGAHVKMTIARYYLPSNRCPHREVDPETGKGTNPDWGVTPAHAVKFRDRYAQRPR